MAAFLLCLSIVLSTGRNLFSKSLSDIPFGTKAFFLCQGTLFLCGAVALAIFTKIPFGNLSPAIALYALVYGLLLIFAQWFYTAALAKGNTGLCSTVYSLGFILPTVSGALLWSEPFTLLDFFGILCATGVILLSGRRTKHTEAKANSHYFYPLVIAMLSSGGLGIVQKLQQSSPYAEDKSLFLFLAFLLAAALSLSFALLAKGDFAPPPPKLAVAAGVGLFFGCCNLLNTSLAGMLDSAILFPTLNIGVILLSILCGALLFKERISKKELSVLILGVLSIALLNLG